MRLGVGSDEDCLVRGYALPCGRDVSFDFERLRDLSMHHVVRGRKIVAAYAIIHFIVTISLILLGIKFRLPLQRTVIGAVLSTMLVHRLWKGSRWAQYLHVVNFALVLFVLVAFCMKLPRPFVLCVGIPLICVYAWLTWTFAFSRSIHEFLAHQRGELPFAPARTALSTAAPGLALPEGNLDLADAEPLASPCKSCGRMLKNFVLLCPDCGARREAVF